MSEAQNPASRRLVVEGHVFEVSASSSDDGHWSVHYAWLNGPDPGYGFSTSAAHPFRMPSEDEAAAEIRMFLPMIDPSTGHMPD